MIARAKISAVRASWGRRLIEGGPSSSKYGTWVFILLFTKPFNCKGFFQNSFYYTRKLKNKTFRLFKTDVYYNIKMKKFLLYDFGQFMAFEMRDVWVEAKELKNYFERARKKISKLFGPVRIPKNCDLGLENAFWRPSSQFSTIRTFQPANNLYISSGAHEQGTRNPFHNLQEAQHTHPQR